MTQQPKPLNKKPLILIAEDNDSSYMLISIMLKEDYNIIRVTNGIEAVKLIEHKHPRLILIDLNEPKMDSLNVIRKIREQDKKLPLIALSTFADSNKEQAMKAGCNGFLTKPVNAEELRIMIKCYVK